MKHNFLLLRSFCVSSSRYPRPWVVLCGGGLVSCPFWGKGACVLGMPPCKSLVHITASYNVEGLRDFTSPRRGLSKPSMKVYTLKSSDRSDTITETRRNCEMYCSRVACLAKLG